MEFIITEIFRGTIVTIIIFLLSYLIEKNSSWDLLFWIFKKKKNMFLTHGAANVNASVFLLVCLVTLLIDLSALKIVPTGYSFWTWLGIMVILCLIIRKVYIILQIKLDKIDKHLSNNE